MQIRPETPADYAAVAGVHARAFGRAVEPAVVALRRQSAGYDPELSLVAETAGHILGHVLLMPCAIRLLGGDVRAVNVAPIAVDPEHQRRGIGSALIGEAHATARVKGRQIAFLLGEPGYYSRFGYRPGAFGSSFVEVQPAARGGAGIHRRGVLPQDGEALLALWRAEEAAVDFAIDPGAELVEWISPRPGVQAWVYTSAGEICGYARIQDSDVRAFLAREDRSAVSIARSLAQDAGAAKLQLPLHPYSRSAKVFGGAVCQPWDAGMACSLAESPFDEYYARLQEGARAPGRPIWPVVFDLG